jgi:uncharacterized protein (DUF4415 family)
MSPAKSKRPARKPATAARKSRVPVVDTSSMSLEERATEVKRAVGRPIDPNLPRAKVWLRIDDDELRAWTAAAEAAGHTISSWLRHLGNKAAAR